MGSKWSRNRRQSSGSLSTKLWSKKKKRSSGAEASQISCDVETSGLNVQKKSCKPQHEFLTEDEQNALLKSWEMIKSSDLQLLGIKVLTRIFAIEPETKQTFSSFRNLTTAQLLENPKFKSHAIRFMRAVEVTMENLDALDVIIIPNLKHLGQLHTDISGFKLRYLDAVEQSMDESWADLLNGKPITVQGYNSNSNKGNNNDSSSGNNNNNNNICKSHPGYDQLTRGAWMKVFKLITSKIMEGFHEGNAAKMQKLKAKSLDASSCSECSTSVSEIIIKDSCPGNISDVNQNEKASESTGRNNQTASAAAATTTTAAAPFGSDETRCQRRNADVSKEHKLEEQVPCMVGNGELQRRAANAADDVQQQQQQQQQQHQQQPPEVQST